MTMRSDLPSDQFFLPDDYIANDFSAALDALMGPEYWTDTRLRHTRLLQAPTYRHAAHMVKQHGFTSLLDVGCGPGNKLEPISKDFPKLRIIGIDQPKTIEFCRRNHRFGTWLIDDIEDPDPAIATLQADMLICSDVISHVRNPDILLRYLRDRLKPEGMILLSTIDRERLLGSGARSPSTKSHVRQWNADELAAYVQSRGFHVRNHFHQYPWQIYPSRVVYKDVIKQLVTRVPPHLKYIQVLELSLNR